MVKGERVLVKPWPEPSSLGVSEGVKVCCKETIVVLPKVSGLILNNHKPVAGGNILYLRCKKEGKLGG